MDCLQRIRLQSTGRKGLTLDPEYQPRNNPTPLPIHYSNLKLVLPSDDPFDPPKIATRLKATPATWSTTRNAFSWSRYPEAVKQLEISTDGRAKLAPKEIWDVGAEATDSMSPVKVKVKHPRVPWPNEGKTAEERGKPGWFRFEEWISIETYCNVLAVYEPGPSETRAEAVQRESFIPISTPFRRDVPELRIPYQEFGGGPFSRARRTARWNARNRDPKTGKIIAQRPGKPYSRRLARINWDRPTKSHPEGLRKSLSQSLSSSAAVAQEQQQVT